MSSRRSIVWLLFFVVLAVAAHVLVSARYGRTVMSARPEVLVPEADEATLFELMRPGQVPVVAVRSDAGWRLIAPFAASVDPQVVLRALDALAFSPVSDVLTAAEMRRLGRSFADFGLENPSLRLNVRRDLRNLAVAFGGPTPTGEGVYATVSDRPGVCVLATNVFAALDLSLDDLRDPRLLADASGALSAVDVRRAEGRFVRLIRTSSGDWQMLEPSRNPVSSARVVALVKMLDEARAGRFVWPVAGETSAVPSVSLLAGYGLDAESSVTVSLTGTDGSSRYVSFGKKADEDSIYALVQNGAAVATVPADLRERLLAAADSFVDLKLFPYDESAITSLSIADGELVYLVARTPGGEWRLDSPVSAPADQDAVGALIRTVLSLRTTERDPQGLVVSVSSNAPAVAVSRDAVLVQNRLEDLRSKTVLRIPSDRIRRISVTSSDGVQDSAVWDAANRTWLPGRSDGVALNGLALAGVLGALDPLVAQSIVRLRISASEAGNYGLEKPRFTLAVDPSAEGAVRRNIMIGAALPGGGAYATVGSTDAVVVLSEATVRALTTRFAASE